MNRNIEKSKVAPAHRPASRRKSRLREAMAALAFVSPTFIILTVFIIFPIFYSFYLSFHEWNLRGVATPVGFENYANLFSDPEFWQAAVNTFYFTILPVPVGMALALVVALALNSGIRGLSFYRTAYFMPVMTSIVAASLIWMWIFNSQTGILNFVFKAVGLPTQAWLNEPGGVLELIFGHYGIKVPRFLAGPSLTLVAVIIMSIWNTLGYNVVIFLAGLQNIPHHLYEVADLDGARGWTKFLHITWPMLSPTTFFVLVMSTITAFQAFAQVAVMTKGGPLGTTNVIVYYIYLKAFQFFEMGFASAAAYILFAVILFFTLLQIRYLGNLVHYE